MNAITVGMTLLGTIGWWCAETFADGLIGDPAPAVEPKERPPQPDKPAPKEDSSKGDLADWMKGAAPGEPHQRLAALAGRWNLVLKNRETPDGNWVESKGAAEYRSVLGGRYVLEEVKTELYGMPFEWVGILGYDNVKKKYTAVWADNFGTQTDFAEGDADAAGKTITFQGEENIPGGGKMKYQWIIRLEGKDKLVIEMMVPGPDGKEFKTMEITGTRAP